MRLNFWRFQLILVLLYFFWGNFFVGDGLAGQTVYNFAVFYPVGFLEGYWPASSGKWTVYAAGIAFNALTYVVAIFAGIPLPNWLTVAVDFASMLIIIWVGTWMGRRLAHK